MAAYRMWESRHRDWTDDLGLYAARRRARKWLSTRHPPFVVEGKPMETKAAALDRLTRLMRSSEPNDIIELTAVGGWRMVIRKALVLTEGDVIVKAALSQLGVDYVWGAESEGKGFDCSGLTRWAVSQATGDIILPHNAEAQRDLATTFLTRDRIKPGDLVFYHVGRLPAGQADHVGVCINRTEVCDASSGLDKVVRRAIDANPVLCFGRFPQVNGPL